MHFFTKIRSLQLPCSWLFHRASISGFAVVLSFSTRAAAPPLAPSPFLDISLLLQPDHRNLVRAFSAMDQTGKARRVPVRSYSKRTIQSTAPGGIRSQTT